VGVLVSPTAVSSSSDSMAPPSLRRSVSLMHRYPCSYSHALRSRTQICSKETKRHNRGVCVRKGYVGLGFDIEDFKFWTCRKSYHRSGPRGRLSVSGLVSRAANLYGILSSAAISACNGSACSNQVCATGVEAVADAGADAASASTPPSEAAAAAVSY